MTSQMEFCKRLAAAPSAQAELALFEQRRELPPPMRSVRYGIRRVFDGKILQGNEFTPKMFDEVEIVLYCDDEGGSERAVVWKPKSLESLQMLFRE